MLAGDNSILKQATKAREETEKTAEKEIIKLAATQAMIKNKSENFEKQDLENELLNKNVTITKSGKNYKIKFNTSDNLYRLTSKGIVKYFEEIEPTKIYAKLESDGTLKLRSTIKDSYEEGTRWNSADILKIIIEEPIAPKSARDMFKDCTNLKEIENIENLHTENITTMMNMFYGCNKLDNLDVSNFDTSKVTTMYYIFE